MQCEELRYANQPPQDRLKLVPELSNQPPQDSLELVPESSIMLTDRMLYAILSARIQLGPWPALRAAALTCDF